VDDATVGVPSLKPKRELAVVAEVEDDPARAQLADGIGGLLDQDLDCAGTAEPTAGGDRVGGVLLRRVARFERRREPALGPEAGALRERGARDKADRAAGLGCAQGGPEPGRATSDDGEVELGNLGRYCVPASRRIAST
jgi:hypothetical protein